MEEENMRDRSSAAPPACTPAQAWAAQAIDCPALLAQGRFDALDRALDEAHAAVRDTASERPFSDLLGLFDAHWAVTTPRRVLDWLTAWAQALPASPMPWLLRARYRDSQAFEARGSGWASSVGADQWAMAGVLRDAAILAACQALARDPGQYRACSTIIRVVGGFGEPEWLVRWLDEGKPPGASDVEVPAGLSAPLAALGLAPGEFADAPPPWPEALGRLLPRRAAQDAKRFWVEAALASHPWARHPVDHYLLFATERWGGSDEAVMAFIDSPLCDRFSEADKNELRFGVQFFDKIAGDNEDPDNRRNDLAVCKKVLRRPLPDWAAACVNLRLARIHEAEARTHEEGSPQRAALLARAEAALASAAPWVGDDMHDLAFLSEFWLLHARNKAWIADVAERHRLHHPYAAMLYGLLLEHGWAGLPRRPDLCDLWYDRAAVGMPPPEEDEGEDPYKVFFVPLCERLGDDVAPLRLIAHGASRGYPSAQFRLAYIHQKRWEAGEAASEEEMLRHYTAAAQRRYWPALFNLVAYLNRKSLSREVDDRTSVALKCQAVTYGVQLLALYDQADEVSPAYADLHQRVLNYFKGLLEWQYERHEEVTQLLLPQLRAKAEAGQLEAMCGMALLHGDKRDKRHRNYREAVRWITAAKRLDAEHPVVLETESVIEGESLWSIFKYLVVAGRIPAHELPGQGGQPIL